MVKPNNFILNSDFATLKNDNKGTISLAITDSGLLAYGAKKTYTSYLDIGTANANLRGQMKTNLSSDIWNTLGMTVPVTVTVYYGGNPVDTFTYNLPVMIDRISATRVRMYATFYSYGYGVDMRITGGYQTITADLVTFLSPFAT